MSEEEYESPYCEVCGTCGYLGCCGIRNFIEEHIKGKTNCKNEEIIINELIDLVEYEEDKDKEIERLNKENDELKDLYNRTCKHLFNIGNDELALYFQAQISNCNVFTPQILDKVEENK